MITKVMKWVSIASLLPAVFWPSSSDYRLVLQFLVCAGALLVAWEAYRSEKHLWMIGFAAMAALFNPFQLWTLSPGMSFWLDLLSIGMFLASLAVLKARPRFSMPSIAT